MEEIRDQTPDNPQPPPDGDAPLAWPGEPPALRELSLPLLITAVILILDQLSKYVIEAHLPLYQSWYPFPALVDYVRIVHTTNTGAAFGLFPQGRLFFTVISIIVAIVIIYYNFILPRGQRGVRIALGLQLGGALGNLLDRLRLGHVTDFVDVDVSSIIYIPYISDWPVFNVADAAIVSGVIILGWILWREQGAVPDAPPADSPATDTSLEESRDPHNLSHQVDEWSTN